LPDRTDLIISRLEREHLDEVLEIERTSFRIPWTRYTFEMDIDSPRAVNLVATESGRVVGYGVAWMLHPCVHIGNLAVAGGERRRGIATLLLERMLGAAEKRGARLATLEVRPSNQAAVSLYSRFGFQAVGRRPHYYVPDNEDAVVMALVLRGGSLRPRDASLRAGPSPENGLRPKRKSSGASSAMDERRGQGEGSGGTR
jgi:ribosomal-protein-alanine N-acetyltransferase